MPVKYTPSVSHPQASHMRTPGSTEKVSPGVSPVASVSCASGSTLNGSLVCTVESCNAQFKCRDTLLLHLRDVHKMKRDDPLYPALLSPGAKQLTVGKLSCPDCEFKSDILNSHSSFMSKKHGLGSVAARLRLDSLDALSAEGVQPAPEPTVVDGENSEPAGVVQVVETDTLLPQSPGPNRQQLEELDAPLAEGVQPAPEPPVLDSDNFEPAKVFEVVENDHDDDGDAHNSRV